MKSPKQSIGTAIVGPGKVAHIHARALAQIPQSRFVGVWGRTPETTRAFASHYGVRAYTDLEAMVQDPAVEMVVICTPHPQRPRPGGEADGRFDGRL